MKQITVITLVVVFSVVIFACAQRQDIKHISAEDVKQFIEAGKNIVLLDVRTPAEHTGPLGNLEGSLLIPVQDLAGRYEELSIHKEKQIIIYCRSGNRSQVAARILQEKGYDVVNMVGGMKAWNKLNQIASDAEVKKE